MSLIDENSPLPLYRQLLDIFKEKVTDGEWPPESRIPTETQLMETYGVGRSTVRNAVLELVRSGFFFRKQGKGTFVAKPKLEADFTREFFPASLGTEHVVLKVSVMDPDRTLRGMLELAEGRKVTELLRLRCIADEPAALEKSYFGYDFCPEMTSTRFTGKVADWLENRGIVIARTRTYLEAGMIGRYEGEILRIRQGMPALLFTRIVYDAGQRPVAVMKSILRGDRIRLVMDSDETEIRLAREA